MNTQQTRKNNILKTIKYYAEGYKLYRNRISFNQSAYFQAIRNLGNQYREDQN